jgi:hypothetical protein
MPSSAAGIRSKVARIRQLQNPKYKYLEPPRSGVAVELRYEKFTALQCFNCTKHFTWGTSDCQHNKQKLQLAGKLGGKDFILIK